MTDFLRLIKEPWPWYIAGPAISIVMFSLLLMGKRFGISSNLRSMCTILGAVKNCEYFDFDWKSQRWNLVFALGMTIGGAIAGIYLSSPDAVAISLETQRDLVALGISLPNGQLVPAELFSWQSLLTFKGALMLIVGGFLIGFGTRYAGGCTSGHAISGLSNLQLPSLIAVIGFFIGGLFVTYIILPFIVTF